MCAADGLSELRVTDFFGQMLRGNEGVLTNDEGVFDGVFEFADVAGPAVVEEKGKGVGSDAGDEFSGSCGMAVDEEAYKVGDVAASFAERGHGEGEDAEAVVEVFPEASGTHFGEEIAVGGGDDADVDAEGFFAADGFEFAFLQDAQKFDLHGGADFSNFIEEEGAGVGGFEASFAVAVGAGEGAFDMAEELAFEQGFGEGAAIDFDEGLGRAGAEGVDGGGGEFLAGAAGAEDEDGAFAFSGKADEALDGAHGFGVADEAVEIIFGFEFGFEGEEFFLEAGDGTEIADGEEDAEGGAVASGQGAGVDQDGDIVACSISEAALAAVDAGGGCFRWFVGLKGGELVESGTVRGFEPLGRLAEGLFAGVAG